MQFKLPLQLALPDMEPVFASAGGLIERSLDSLLPILQKGADYGVLGIDTLRSLIWQDESDRGVQRLKGELGGGVASDQRQNWRALVRGGRSALELGGVCAAVGTSLHGALRPRVSWWARGAGGGVWGRGRVVNDLTCRHRLGGRHHHQGYQRGSTNLACTPPRTPRRDRGPMAITTTFAARST